MDQYQERLPLSLLFFPFSSTFPINLHGILTGPDTTEFSYEISEYHLFMIYFTMLFDSNMSCFDPRKYGHLQYEQTLPRTPSLQLSHRSDFHQPTRCLGPG